MKNPSFQTISKSAFTLVEMLIVILIVGVLAGLVTVAGSRAVNSARGLQAKNAIASIENAVNSFYSEYSKMPIASNTTDFAGDASNATVRTALEELTAQATSTAASGSTPAYNSLNRRGFKFLTYNEAKNSKDGIIYTSTLKTNIANFVDPWGRPFEIKFDSNLDYSITGPNNYPTTLIIKNKRVLIYSRGKDGLLSTSVRNRLDDIKNW